MTAETLIDPPTAASVNDLDLVRETGEGTRNLVNTFLDLHHPLGGVPHWVAAWSARYEGHIVAALVLNRGGRMVDDDEEINIQRLARRDDRPANTCSWLISKARTWADLEGYERITALSGVAGNFGTVYEAAGFELLCPHCRWSGPSRTLGEHVVDDETVEVCPECGREPFEIAEGDGWLRHDGDRETYDDYERRKWVDHLSNCRRAGGDGDG